MTEPIKIDVWSDIACPWCYIGKRNLDAGLATAQTENPDIRIDVEYRSYELAPDTPVDFEGDEIDYLTGAAGMTREHADAILDRVSKVAREAGLEYRFDLLNHTNTVQAHELMHYAKTAGKQREMAERLMSAYFIEGRHVGRVDDLVSLAEQVGLDGDGARAALEQRTYFEDVRADQALAKNLGINGVPFFVIDGKYGVSGAQPPEAFAQIARQIWAEHQNGEQPANA